MAMTATARDRFNNKLEYFLTSLSYAVGLGNVWRFPYLCYRNGGGSFLVPYLLSLLFLGLPFFFFESSIGQFTNLGPIKVWRLCPLFKGIGFAMFVMGAYVGIYYNIVIAWSLYYVYASIIALPEVPWAKCSNEWNTANCVDAMNRNRTILNHTSPSQEFFYHQVLNSTQGIEFLGPLRWPLVLCLAIAWIFIYCGLCLGAKSLGKVSYFTAFFPYVMITALLIKGIQLEGSSDGIAHYLRPNFEKLTDINVWSDAATQIFYSLSICMGGVINLASYNSFYNNLFNDSILIVICNSLTSIYAGFAIFSVIGFMAKEMGSTIEEAADQGVGLAFVAYPAALAHLPFPSIWSIIFFLMIITLGFGSQMTIVETIVSTIVDFWPKKFQKHKPIVLGGVCLILFLSGIPLCTGAGIYILQLMDTYSVPYSAFFIAIAELIAIFWVYGFDNYLNNLFKMLGFHIWPLSYWKVMFKFICPTIISCLLFIVIVKHEPLVYNDYIFPQYTEYIGWTMTFSSALMMPLFASIEFWKVYVDGRKTLKDILRPEVNFEDPSKRKKIKETPKSIDTLKKNFNENSFIIGEDNPGYVEDEKLNPKPNNLKDSSIEIKMNGNRLLNLSSLSTWTFGDSQEYPIDRKLSSSPSLQNVFQSN